MKKRNLYSLLVVLASILIFVTACGQEEKEVLNILNYDIYIDKSLLNQFEIENNVTIKYDTYSTPEEMYIKAKAGASNYDLIISSEYMIERMINEGMVNKLNFENIPNYNFIGEEFKNQPYDPNNEYAVPYFWGTLGILYNKNTVDVSSKSWEILWDKNHDQRIIMMDSQRDSFAAALRLLGYSLNTVNEQELDEAKELLLKQKPLVMAYITDGAPDIMINEEADMALVWSGEAVSAMEENENLDFVIPKEGSNIWIDAMFIPATTKNQTLSEKFIDFLCSKESTLRNIDEVWYSTVHTDAIKEVDEELLNNEAFNIPAEDINNMEMFRDPKEFIDLYSSRWTEVMAQEAN
ncbi:spermidine/putrescine transport system substrate-binding protein [Sedimentibacter acidaminivorans]|jgi:spermidine/putrescine transport system substrate-binding protein|uniref:Spermidine/putrescine transport system substrate-binding protein n=1 Tax=Sedimentibacter acidaminivorans TaxID=913099 RepID=A0ABS4GE30_9FIRM|nr:ABC transporter substrate-binding protein [Sedimentibacter acidaminivorans]MBP1925951.1 spermidine/putrescine transport system substrate-binding protein [Sedimentibacter acidaminivorans]